MGRRKLLLACVGLVAGATIFFACHIYSNEQKIVPTDIAKKISFVLFWPGDVTSKPSKQSIKFDPKAGVFSFIVRIDNTSVTVNEQATPSEFTDIPNYYSSLVNHMDNYATFSSAHGTVYLTKPAGTGGEVAVDNQSGTLIFAHAESDLDTNTWRLLFNNLKIVEN